MDTTTAHGRFIFNIFASLAEFDRIGAVDAKRIAFYAYKNRDEVRLWTPKLDVIQKLDGSPRSLNCYP
jgi:DNA invertase Pin-like site-specific DNA recombinase